MGGAVSARLDLACGVRHLVARPAAAPGEGDPIRAAPVSEWLERIDAARAALAATAGLPVPLAVAPRHVEIS